jgi:penicillin-binding protein 1A
VRDFMKVALADKPAVPFRVPAGIKLIRVDARSGMRASPGQSGGTILEAFKPGTAPPDNYSVIGVADADGRGGGESGYVGGGYPQQQPAPGPSFPSIFRSPSGLY